MVFGLHRTLDVSTNFGVSAPVEFIPGTEVPADYEGMPEVSSELREVLIGCLQKDEQQGWGDHQLQQCSWLRSGSPGAGAEAEDFHDTKDSMYVEELEWHVLDMGGHEYPNSDTIFRDRYKTEEALAPKQKQVQ